MADELKPCPFCGGPAYFTKSVNGSQMNYVGCSECGIAFKAARTNIPLDSPMTKDIVAAWNRRVNDGAKRKDEMNAQRLDQIKRRAEQGDPVVGVGDTLTNGELLELIQQVTPILDPRWYCFNCDALVGADHIKHVCDNGAMTGTCAD